MDPRLSGVLIFIGSYLIGSISPSIMISSFFFKKNIKKEGSKNAGATNVARVFGLKVGVLVACLDILKAWIPVRFLPLIFTAMPSPEMPGMNLYWKLAFISGLGVLAGHIFPLYHAFKGGKGVACAAGICAVLFPEHIAWLLGAFVISFAAHKRAFPASITAAVCLSALVIAEKIYDAFRFHSYRVGAAVFISMVIIWAHRSNFREEATKK